jgi:hypothetical protein
MYTRCGNWRIETTEWPLPFRYEVVHESYDGAPDSGDHRAALARSLTEAHGIIQDMEAR